MTTRESLVRTLTCRKQSVSYKDRSLCVPSSAPEVRMVPTSDGARLRVHVYGAPNAPTIVLSHGWTCGIEFWYPQINALADRFRVVAYDQRGHGGSSVGTRRFSSDVLADDLAAVLSVTVPRGQRAVLVGHSMGGMTIMAWAGKYPEQVREFASAAVLANTGSDSLVAETTAVPFLPGIDAVRRLAGQVLSAPVPLPRLRGVTDALRFVAMSPSATREQVDFCVRIVLSCSGRIRGRWGTALHRLDLRDAVPNLAVPTVVFGGGRDRMTPPVHSERLAEALRAAGQLDRLLIVPTSGHMGPVEAADQLTGEIIRLAAATTGRRLRAVAG